MPFLISPPPCRQDLLLNELSDKNARKDNFGTVIERGGPHKLVFADDPVVAHRDRRIEVVHIVESFKSFNRDMSRQPTENSCCATF